MSEEQRRKEFEEWADSRGFFLPKGNKYISPATEIAWEGWQAAIQKEIDEYCPLSDPNHPHGIRFREDSPTPTNPNEP